MLLQKHEPLGDTPPGYWQDLAASRWRHLLLTLLAGAGAGIAWWVDSHRLTFFLSLMSGTALLHLAMGSCVVLWRSIRFRRAGAP